MNNSAIEDIKKQLELDITSGNPYWNITPETASVIVSILKKQTPMHVLEIGTSVGYSAICMAEVLSHWSGELITVESHAERFGQAQANITASGLTNITQIQGHAPEILADIPGTFDAIFLDATKYEHTSYFLALKERVNKGGIIIADNMLSHETDMALYKKTVESDPQFESIMIEVGTGLMVSTHI